jgi:NodT family efflux transporter outer membrane factor (OMF) lipoprotein
MHRLSLLALAISLSACSLTPTRPATDAQIPVSFPTAAAEGRAAASLRWQDFVQDPRSRALVELSLSGNRDLRLALLAVEQARASAGVTSAERLPQIGVGANLQRISGGGDNYQLGLQLSAYEVDLFGRLRSLDEAAAARLLASEAGQRAARLALITSVVDTELQLRGDEALLDLTRQTLSSREATLRLTQSRVDAGVAALPELRVQQSLVAAARINLAAIERQQAQRQNLLQQLVGAPLPVDLPTPRPLAQQTFAELPPGLPAGVLAVRPDVQQTEAQLDAALAQVGAARAARFPRLSLTASAGGVSSQLSEVLETGGWSLGANLLQPLFDAGRLAAQQKSAEVGVQIAATTFEKTVQTAYREVADALSARQTLVAQLQAQQAQASAEADRLQLAEQREAQGVASALERLDAERSLLAARQAELQLQLQLRQNAVQLYKALGGGT